MTFSEKMPESEAHTVRLAANLMQLLGEAENFKEALRNMAVEYIESRRPQLEHWAEKASEDHWRWLVYMAHFEQGGRCLICGTSKMIDPHHGVPRSDGGPDDLSNLFLLCRKDHDHVTFAKDGAWHWRGILPKLRVFKADRIREMNTNGYATRRDRTHEVEMITASKPLPRVLAMQRGARA